MALYIPEHFALTAGAELSGSKAGEVPSIPKVFGYYAETAAYQHIINVQILWETMYCQGNSDWCD